MSWAEVWQGCGIMFVHTAISGLGVLGHRGGALLQLLPELIGLRSGSQIQSYVCRPTMHRSTGQDEHNTEPQNAGRTIEGVSPTLPEILCFVRVPAAPQ